MNNIDIIINILQWLSLEDLKVVQYTNKHFHCVLQDEHFWYRKMHLDYNSQLKVFWSSLSWKQKYFNFTKICNLCQEYKSQ